MSLQGHPVFDIMVAHLLINQEKVSQDYCFTYSTSVNEALRIAQRCFVIPVAAFFCELGTQFAAIAKRSANSVGLADCVTIGGVRCADSHTLVGSDSRNSPRKIYEVPK